MMIPARNICPSGWTNEYNGFLVSSYKDHAGKNDYVCLDENPEVEEGTNADHNGALMNKVVAACGSLPCPGYEDNRVQTCAVCSM